MSAGTERPWFRWECTGETVGQPCEFDGEDAHFLLRAKRAGFQPHLDPTVTCNHIIGTGGVQYDHQGEVRKAL